MPDTAVTSLVRVAEQVRGGHMGVPQPSSIDQIVIVNDFATTAGGATAIALSAAELYQQQGYKVTFISGDGPSERLRALGIEHVALNAPALLKLPFRKAIAQGFHHGAAARAVSEWIARHDTPGTAYHLHNWSQILSPAIFSALRPVEGRLVVTCHDFFNICPNGGFSHFGDAAVCQAQPMSLQCLASNCDRRSYAQKIWRTGRHVNLNVQARFARSKATFTFLHEAMRQKFVDCGFAAPDLVTIPNPAHAWTDRRIEAERNRGLLFVGRIARDKGADIAIRAAKDAGQKITLVGSGELGRMPEESDGDVEFAGWCDREEIAAIASRARALIVPSRILEPFGLVLVEAAMSGLPVIVASHALLARDLVDMGCGVAFGMGRSAGPGSPEPGRVVARLATDDDLVRRMSHAGFDGARRLCSDPVEWISAFIAIFERKIEAFRSAGGVST
ncbi:glycosyltransferase family 4 protein [Novosphingobium sp. ZN18A2]|uniref:glycosyltransferase family 4 protein n=1 Tax=Novosphingobium sp. ZN18A2 TaxID=3079861 RepID=UPI0030CDD253